MDEDGVIYLGSFSKTFAPGFRVGWAVAPHAVREKLVLASEAAILCPSNASQMAISSYLDHHDWKGQIKKFREQYRERRDAMIAALEEFMPDASWNVPEGGFYVWVKLPEGLDAKSMLPRAVTARVAYVPGTAFYYDGTGADSHAAVLLLPDAGADPRGRAPPRGRRRCRDGDRQDLRQRLGRGVAPRWNFRHPTWRE